MRAATALLFVAAMLVSTVGLSGSTKASGAPPATHAAPSR
jgi:hypothetical protein